MANVQEHTLRIGNLYMYAQTVSLPAMFKTRTPIEIPIQNGPPKWYYGAMKLRQFTCLVTMYGKHDVTRKQLESINNKVVPFVSVYIGSFNAMVTMTGDITDGAPNMLKVKLAVQEVV